MNLRLASAALVAVFATGGPPSQGQPPQSYEGNCTDSGCHDAYAKKPVVHNPVETGTCDACHEPVEGPGHKFGWVEEGGDLCLECHEFDDGNVEHQPVAEGQCTVCHDPHASTTSKLLTAPSVGEVCNECHEDLTEDMTYLHGPLATGACTACHDPHVSDHPKLLSGPTRELCLKCHAELGMRLKVDTGLHEPVGGECTVCHDPHGSDYGFNLRTTPPELCLDCHDTLAELLENATVTHDALTTKRSCLNCHDPHVSKVNPLLIREPMELCLSCHNEELKSDEGMVMDIAGHLEKNPHHHGPIQDKNCSGCHNPHGGEIFRMLNEQFPARFYSPFEEDNYALCFDCHDVELAEEEETDEDTEFRNGERNLHFLHVNREVKGRTCRACHDFHASSNPKHIRESAPFGEWSIPINFEQQPNGGSCQPGCHRKYRYDRETPVVNIAER